MTDRPRAEAHARPDFRADLEGLRAVAIVLVLLYHAQVPGFSGGYVGVDVFFVLSGFLITGILLRERGETGRISLVGFYARRARRILPAAALVLLATVAVAAVFLPPLRVADIGRDAAAAALYVSNIRFGLQATDYLQAQAAPSPLLHYWSLGVEEQFYVFWPAIVLLVCRRGGSIGRRIGLTAVSIAAVSVVLSLWMTVVNAPWAFFSLPTRAWELGLGAILAVSTSRLARVPERLAAVLGWAGLTAVALSSVILSDATPFPGTAALLPTVGAAFVIAAGFRTSALAPGRVLGMSIPRYVGRISYSLYLWHWPLLVIPEAAAGAPLTLPTRLALVGAAFALAATTQRWVEDPLRRGRIIGTRPARNLALAGAISAAVVACSLGLGAAATQGLSEAGSSSISSDDATVNRIVDQALAAVAGRSIGALPQTVDGPVPGNMRPAIADARDLLPEPYLDGCHLSTGIVDSPPCVYGDPNGSHTVVLFGDSHAVQWWPALERLSHQRGWRLVNYTKSACAPVDAPQWDGPLKRVYTECQVWRENTLTRIASLHPDLVIVSGNKPWLVQPDGVPYSDSEALVVYRSGLTRQLQRLAQTGTHVVLLGNTPLSEYDVPVCLSAHRDSILACATPPSYAVSATWRAATESAAVDADADYVDPTFWVCPSAPCPPVVGNFLVYRDNQHLTLPFAQALSGRLADELPKLAQGVRPAAGFRPLASQKFGPPSAVVDDTPAILSDLARGPERTGRTRRRADRNARRVAWRDDPTGWI